MEPSLKIPLLLSAKKFSYKLEGEKLTALIKTPRPVLLECEGMYTWFNINKIKNFVRRCADEELRAKNNERPYIPHIIFKWNRNVVDVYLADAIKKLLEKENKEGITCSFCNETGFDLVGLKYHLHTHCDVMKSTKELLEEK